ncbi:MAG: PepSY domain-containing protein [Pseudoxanthomonas sp.]
MKTSIRFLSVTALTITTGLLIPVSAVLAGKHDHDHVEVRELLRRGEILPLAKVLEAVTVKVPGDVIEVELDREDANEGGGWEYKVKVLTPDGRVRKITLDARTGAVLKVKDD